MSAALMSRRNTSDKPNGPAGPQSGVNGNAPHDVADKVSKGDGKAKPIPGGEFPLPDNPGAFVDEIHRRVDLFEIWQKLLSPDDPKIQQRARRKLTQMPYKGPPPLPHQPQHILIPIQSPSPRPSAEI